MSTTAPDVFLDDNSTRKRKRKDGRYQNDIRPLSTSYGELARSDGSCSFGFGPLNVLASVNGPIEVKIRDELVDRATFEVNVRPLRGIAGPQSKFLSQTISSILSPLILLNSHPRSLIQLNIQTTSKPQIKFSRPFTTSSFVQSQRQVFEKKSSDGTASDTSAGKGNVGSPKVLGQGFEESMSEKAACINASFGALMDSAVAMKGSVVAVSCAVVRERREGYVTEDGGAGMMELDEEEAGGGEGGEGGDFIVLDPSAEEEEDAISVHCFAWAFGKAVVGARGEGGEMVYCESYGKVEDDRYFELVELSQLATQRIFAFVRKSAESRYGSSAAIKKDT